MNENINEIHYANDITVIFLYQEEICEIINSDCIIQPIVDYAGYMLSVCPCGSVWVFLCVYVCVCAYVRACVRTYVCFMLYRFVAASVLDILAIPPRSSRIMFQETAEVGWSLFSASENKNACFVVILSL